MNIKHPTLSLQDEKSSLRNSSRELNRIVEWSLSSWFEDRVTLCCKTCRKYWKMTLTGLSCGTHKLCLGTITEITGIEFPVAVGFEPTHAVCSLIVKVLKIVFD